MSWYGFSWSRAPKVVELSASLTQVFPDIPPNKMCPDEAESRRFVVEVRGDETILTAKDLGFDASEIENPVSVCFLLFIVCYFFILSCF